MDTSAITLSVTEAIEWKRKRKGKRKPWFGTFFSEPDPGKNKI